MKICRDTTEPRPSLLPPATVPRAITKQDWKISFAFPSIKMQQAGEQVLKTFQAEPADVGAAAVLRERNASTEGLSSPESGCAPCSGVLSPSISSCTEVSLASLPPSPSGALLGTASSSFSCFWMKDSIAASDRVPETYKSAFVPHSLGSAVPRQPPTSWFVASSTTRAAHCPSAETWHVATRLQQPPPSCMLIIPKQGSDWDCERITGGSELTALPSLTEYTILS